MARRKGNPLSYFDRLKAELPGRHVDRALIATVEVKAEVPAEQAADLIRRRLPDLSDATKAILEGRVLDAHSEDVL